MGHYWYLPIIYKDKLSENAFPTDFSTELKEWLHETGTNSAIEYIDSIITDFGPVMQPLFLKNIRHLRHSVLPLYDGNEQHIQDFLATINLDNVESTNLFWSQRVNTAIVTLSNFIPKASNTDTPKILHSLSDLKKAQEHLPQSSDLTNSFEITPPNLNNEQFKGDENLIDAFQNRGNDQDKIRNYFSNSEIKVVIISGRIGIGKTDFVNLLFRKQLSDWEPLRIILPNDCTFARLLTEIGYRIGIPLDSDSLSVASTKIINQKIKKVLRKIYSISKRAMIIDDLHSLLKGRSIRDYTLFKIFLEAAASPEEWVGGRILVLSSQWLPETLINKQGIMHMPLTGLNDKYIRRIIEYHMRRLKLVEGETIPQPPQPLLDLIKNHPLSAKLVAESLKNIEINKLIEKLNIENISKSLSERLLENISLEEKDIEALKLFSVFRLPIKRNALTAIPELKDFDEVLLSLASRCIIGFDGNIFEIHEAVRRHFESLCKNGSFRLKYHSFATFYYEYLNQGYKSTGTISNFANVAELVYHLSMIGDTKRLKEYKLILSHEIIPAARILYKKQKDYSRSLELFRLVESGLPNDVNTLAYIGRCFGRLGQWSDCDIYFQKAIDAANKTGEVIWWLYRDWGHIRSRFGFYIDAEEYFKKAMVARPNDSSILSQLAFMREQQGINDEARDYYEKAINSNQFHDYSLSYYARFLDKIGDYLYANVIKKRLADARQSNDYRIPDDFEQDIEYDD